MDLPRAPAIRWLYGALRAAILDGRLRGGARLPATRDLARHHRLSRGTIVAAFEQLKSEGYVEASAGSGTYVARILPDRLLQVERSPRAPRAPRSAERSAISGVEAELQTAGWLREGVDGPSVAEAAARRDVEVLPLSRYAGGPLSRDGLVLGFAAVDAHEIRRGVRELASVLDAPPRARRGGSADRAR